MDSDRRLRVRLTRLRCRKRHSKSRQHPLVLSVPKQGPFSSLREEPPCAAHVHFLPFAALALTQSTPSTLAQNPAPPVPETITTADGVKLKGFLHTSPLGAAQNHAVVVLLYQPGVGNSMAKPGDWDALAKDLLKAGFPRFPVRLARRAWPQHPHSRTRKPSGPTRSRARGTRRSRAPAPSGEERQST